MNVFDAWAFAKPILEPAIVETKGTHTIEDVCLMLGMGHFTLWTGDKSALLTEFITYPRMKVINCFAGGGDMAELIKLRDESVIPFAKKHGCTRIIGAGRKGWTKTLPGFEFGGVYMHKDF